MKFFITAEYPDLWPIAVDELLRVTADLAGSVQDFIGATESSSPSHFEQVASQGASLGRYRYNAHCRISGIVKVRQHKPGADLEKKV